MAACAFEKILLVLRPLNFVIYHYRLFGRASVYYPVLITLLVAAKLFPHFFDSVCPEELAQFWNVLILLLLLLLPVLLWLLLLLLLLPLSVLLPLFRDRNSFA